MSHPALPPVEDPAGFDLDGEEDADLQPVEVAQKRKKRKSKAKTPKSKKAKSEGGEPASGSTPEPAVSRDEAINSFPDSYQALIKTLPVCLWPVSTKHGQHSYTV